MPDAPPEPDLPTRSAWPHDVPWRVPRSESRFLDDARQALAVCRQQPALPALSAVVGVLTAISGSRWPGASVVSIVVFALMGWVGAERLWYLRAFTDRTMTPAEALRWTRRYFGRFFRLFVLTVLAAAPLGIPVAIGVVRATQTAARSGEDIRLGVGLLVYMSAVALVIDFALTFVTPALVYATSSAREAVGIGFRLLRATWPHAAPYVLLPPLAVVVLMRMFSDSVGMLGSTVVVLTSLLSLIARGATCALYLRVMTPAGPDGATAA